MKLMPSNLIARARETLVITDMKKLIDITINYLLLSIF